MIKTQIQIPDELFRDIKALAKSRNWSLAEALRRGAEQLLLIYPNRNLSQNTEWSPPVPKKLGRFLSQASEWREQANIREKR